MALQVILACVLVECSRFEQGMYWYVAAVLLSWTFLGVGEGRGEKERERERERKRERERERGRDVTSVY